MMRDRIALVCSAAGRHQVRGECGEMAFDRGGQDKGRKVRTVGVRLDVRLYNDL